MCVYERVLVYMCIRVRIYIETHTHIYTHTYAHRIRLYMCVTPCVLILWLQATETNLRKKGEIYFYKEKSVL